MIKKINQQKKAINLKDRSTGGATAWGIIWNKGGYEFGLVPRDLSDAPKANVDDAIAELSDHLSREIKVVDRIQEYYSISYEPGHPSHIQEIRLRDNKTVVAYDPKPLFNECYFVVTEVDVDFCVIENITTGETKVEMKGRLFGVPVNEMSRLALHWTECYVLAADRLRLGIDLLRQSKKEATIAEGQMPSTDE